MANQCLEETITLKETGDTYKYSLSNSHTDIEAAIYARTRHSVSLVDVVPKLNPKLSVSVKEMMTRNNAEFSMTIFTSNGYEYVVVNRHANGQWYSAFLVEMEGKLCLLED